MRIDEKHSAAAEWQKPASPKLIFEQEVWRGTDSSSPASRKGPAVRIGARRRAARENVGETGERRLPIELQIVFAFQDVVEDAQTAPNAGLAVSKNVLSKTKAAAQNRSCPGKFAPFGAPGSPGKTRPWGALGNRCDCNPGINENVRPCVSYFGSAYSYRRPNVSVRRLLTRH